MVDTGLRIEPGLRGAVDGYLGRGYLVSGLTATTARLVKPRRFNVTAALLWLLFFGGGLVLYLIYFALSRDEVVDVRLGADGRIHARRRGPTPRQTAIGVAAVVIAGVLLVALVIGLLAFI